MGDIYIRIKKVIILLRFAWVSPGVKWEDSFLNQDIIRWKRINHIKGNKNYTLAYLLWKYPEFRNLFIFRNRFRRFYRLWIALWYRPMETLYLQAEEIGGGLFIQHGFSTMVSAETIGENCWINQQVTIGYNGHGRPPVIGNNVVITCGAKVLGSITIGDNVVIGANAVVIRDVESGITVAGIPAHRI